MTDSRASTEASSKPRVHVFGWHDSREEVEEIVRGLGALNVDATAPFPVAGDALRAVIVVLSAEATIDPEWNRLVESLSNERLVPVLVGKIDDRKVPNYLRELNWIAFDPDDQGVVAKLFTGINTEVARFRDARDTRVLAERWENSRRNADYLIEDQNEVKRRLEGIDGGSGQPHEFLRASLVHAKRAKRRRTWSLVSRTGLAAVAAFAVFTTVAYLQQANNSARNAVSFEMADAAGNERPDIAALKAAASLAESADYPGDDGRLRITADALSRHWSTGHLLADGAIADAAFLEDDTIAAVDSDGNKWLWNLNQQKSGSSPTGAGNVRGADISANGSRVVSTNGLDIEYSVDGSIRHTLSSVGNVVRIRSAQNGGRAMIQVDNELRTISGLESQTVKMSSLGKWDKVYDVIQSDAGDVVALVERGGKLQIVRDDGSSGKVVTAPPSISLGTLSPSGDDFAVVSDSTIWTTVRGDIESSGIIVPGIDKTIRMTESGLVLIADRTRGAWVAAPQLGIDLGPICSSVVGVYEFVVNSHNDQVLCVQPGSIGVDSLEGLAPISEGGDDDTSVKASSSIGRVESLELHGGFIRLDLATGESVAFDSRGLSGIGEMVMPDEIASVDYFATGATIGAIGIPTAVSLTEDGNSFAIGFQGGRFIEVDVDSDSKLVSVGSWQLADHSAVSKLQWKGQGKELSIVATTSTATWSRASCVGCSDISVLISRVANRAWFCYLEADLRDLGESARETFNLQSCERYWSEWV